MYFDSANTRDTGKHMVTPLLDFEGGEKEGATLLNASPTLREGINGSGPGSETSATPTKGSRNGVMFQNYDDKEEATCIEEITFLSLNSFKAYVIAPILVVCSGLIFGLFLFWYLDLRVKFFYDQVHDIKQATHVLVKGVTKNQEILPLYSGRGNNLKDTFVYRFIKFEFDFSTAIFKPVIFDVKFTHAEILQTFSKGIR